LSFIVVVRLPSRFWRCGFYPGSNPGDAANGTAADFDAARTAFESDWSTFLAKRTEADFLEYRRHRASTEWKYAMWGAGCKLPTQMTTAAPAAFAAPKSISPAWTRASTPRTWSPKQPE
jgi:hypothetical protein